MTETTATAGTPDRIAVLRQMEDLLGHSAFRRSARCTKLLRYLVEKSLDDPGFLPKERTLAIEVFGRRPDYDTAADPIVRTTANEIRKRLGAYFHDTGAAAEAYIELPSGSYRPIFRSPPSAALTETRPTPATRRPQEPGLSHSRKIRTYVLAASITAAVVLVVGALLFWQEHPRSNADRFWHPFLYPPRTIVVCTPNSSAAPSVISVSDSKAVWRVLSILVRKEDNVSVRANDRVTANDLRGHPAIIIGGLNNPWSAFVLSRLRFRLVADDSTHIARISDQQSPSEQRWFVDTSDLSKDHGRSYALISRLVDPVTHNPTLNIAGVGMYATAAAGEFLAQPEHLNALGSALDRCSNNMQLVLSAEANNGVVSRRNVEAIYCW